MDGCCDHRVILADDDLLTTQLLAAGFENIVLERYDTDIRVGSTIDEVVKIAMDIGPAGEIVRLAGERRERKPEIVAALREVSSKYMRPDGAFAPSSTWLVSATRSA